MKILRNIKFGRTEKPLIYTDKGKVFIGISYFRNSSVRVADSNGNHIYTPKEAVINDDYFVEWMITNREIALLLGEFLTNQEIQEVVSEFKKIDSYIEQQRSFIGRKIDSDEKNAKEFMGFKIIPRAEKFFTFKKNISKANSFVEVTFKPGDVSPMEEHMYMLIPFSNLQFIYGDNILVSGNKIGQPCFAIWSPSKEEIKEIAKTIGYTSEKHKNQLIEEITKL